jgi:peroxiredoxin
MVELGQLEEHHADFDNKNVRVVAISQDDLENSKKTQEACPHLQIVSDADANIANALDLMDKVHHGPKGQDTNAPTTILVDGDGMVRWVYRADRFMVRLSPDELLKAVDEHLGGKGSQASAQIRNSWLAID